MNYKGLVLLVLSAFLSTIDLSARALQAGNEYYIIHAVYDKVLGSSEDGKSPALSKYITGEAEADSYVFVAEESGKEGYVLLKQKSTGRYLASSTSNSYSIVFQSTRSTDDAYCWRVNEGMNSYMRNKRNTSRRVGVDGGHGGNDYVSIYYDKIQGSHATFHIVPVTGENVTDALRAYESEEFTNAIGNKEIDYHQIFNKQISRSDTVDIHICANTNAIMGTTSKITLGSLGTWLIFENITPSEVIDRYLKYVYIRSSKAAVGTNCRVAIYLNGAAVIPTLAGGTLRPMEVYNEPNLEGKRTYITVGNRTTLGNNSNTTRSFILRRGYMATVATGISGEGYSRVYVADHHDIVINELPTALDRRISSIFVKEWQYVSKKGWCSTTGQGANETEAGKMRATWFYTWSADRHSTNNLEYIPIRQHIYWPSMSTINGFTTSSAALSLNEPDHSEQHDNCDCKGTITPWKACTITPDFVSGGERIGSPAPTDASWLTEYIGHVDDMAYRCDFVAFHAYWGTNEAANASVWYSRLKDIYNKTKRPIWITEWNNGASWTTESWPSNWSDKLEKNRKAIQEIVEMLDTCSFIERYAIYNWDTNYRAMINWDDGYVQPAGQVYRDARSTFAYNAAVQKVPNWWTPAAQAPSFVMTADEATGKLTFIISNPNTDMTESLRVERLAAGTTEWQTIAELSESADRYKFENKSITIDKISSEGFDLAKDRFRVTVVTLTGKTVNSSTKDMGLLKNPTIETTSKTTVEGWTCVKDAANGYTKSTGDTYLEVWDATAANINFNYYQDLTDLEDGIYSLSANVFNYADGQGAEVNGAVGLYAQTSDQLYFVPVLVNDTLKADNELTIERIVVTDGKLRVGIRNIGVMNARWAGGDNFMLVRDGDLDEIDIETEKVRADIQLYQLMPSLNTEDASELAVPRDATRFIVNPDANRENSYGWTTSNIELKHNNESFNADASNPYWNIWMGSAFNSSLTQEINGLPEGTYTLSSLLRGSDAAAMTLSASTSETNSVQQSFTGVGQTAGEYPQGWNLITTPAIKVGHGETLKIGAQMKSSKSAWWSADHFQLTLTGLSEAAVGIIDIDHSSLTSGHSTFNNLHLYDLSGRRIGNGQSSTSLKPGIYIIAGRKFVVR